MDTSALLNIFSRGVQLLFGWVSIIANIVTSWILGVVSLIPYLGPYLAVGLALVPSNLIFMIVWLIVLFVIIYLTTLLVKAIPGKVIAIFIVLGVAAIFFGIVPGLFH